MKNPRKYLDLAGGNLTSFTHGTIRKHYHPLTSSNSNKSTGNKGQLFLSKGGKKLIITADVLVKTTCSSHSDFETLVVLVK